MIGGLLNHFCKEHIGNGTYSFIVLLNFGRALFLLKSGFRPQIYAGGSFLNLEMITYRSNSLTIAVITKMGELAYNLERGQVHPP